MVGYIRKTFLQKKTFYKNIYNEYITKISTKKNLCDGNENINKMKRCIFYIIRIIIYFRRQIVLKCILREIKKIKYIT